MLWQIWNCLYVIKQISSKELSCTILVSAVKFTEARLLIFQMKQICLIRCGLLITFVFLPVSANLLMRPIWTQLAYPPLKWVRQSHTDDKWNGLWRLQVSLHLRKSVNAIKTLLIYLIIPFLYFLYFIGWATNHAQDQAITISIFKHHQASQYISNDIKKH